MCEKFAHAEPIAAFICNGLPRNNSRQLLPHRKQTSDYENVYSVSNFNSIVRLWLSVVKR